LKRLFCYSLARETLLINYQQNIVFFKSLRKTAPILTQTKQSMEVAFMLLCNIKLSSKQKLLIAQYLFNHIDSQIH